MDDSETIDTILTSVGSFSLSRRIAGGAGDVVYEISLDDSVLMSSLSPFSETKLATLGCSLHQSQGRLSILVGGLGLGHTAHQALADPRVTAVHVIEKMEFCIHWMKKGLLPLSSALSSDKRINISCGDVYKTLLGPATKTYDLILIDVDHSPDAPLDASSKNFYSTRGQQAVMKHLNPSGILGVWSIEDHHAFYDVLKSTYGETQREYVRWADEEFPEADFENVLFFARKNS